MHYVGLDLHKEIIQIAVVDKDGTMLLNKKIYNSHAILKTELARMPKNAQYVMESSSVWEGVYNFMTRDLGLDIVLSNPYKTRLPGYRYSGECRPSCDGSCVVPQA